MKSPRKNLNKDQIKDQIANDLKVKHIKEVVRIAFPAIDKLDTVYDAQTAVNALSGLIESEIESIVKDIKMSSLAIDLSEEKDSKIKAAILKIISLFPDESAQELSETLERLGTTLQAYVSGKGMSEKMKIKVDDIVTK